MKISSCPQCNETQIVKSGIIKDRQQYLCKKYNYYFNVNKIANKIDNYYISKSLQLYREGISYREIECIIGLSHVTVSNWVRDFIVRKPSPNDRQATYRICYHAE